VNDLEDEFRRYGKIRDVWIARNPPGFAFLEFQDAHDAQDAVKGEDNRMFLSNRICVEISRRGRKQYDRNHTNTNTTNNTSNPRDYDRDRNHDRDRDRRRTNSYSRSRSRDRRRSRDDNNRDRDYQRDHRDRDRRTSTNTTSSMMRIRTAHRIKLFNLPESCDWKALKAFILQLTALSPAFVDVLTPTEGTVEFFSADDVPKAIALLDQVVFPSSTDKKKVEGEGKEYVISVVKDTAPVQDIRMRPLKPTTNTTNNSNSNDSKKQVEEEEEEVKEELKEEEGKEQHRSSDRRTQRDRDRSRSGEPAE